MQSPDTTSPATNSTPAETGMWVFVFADMSIFAMYFAVFAWEKNLLPEQFELGQATLNNYYGALNTFILLVSSYFMASAVHAARQLDISDYLRRLKITMLLGAAFLAVKSAEYSEKFSQGFNIASNEFYRNYFSFTGFHMIHVIVGISLLLFLYFSMNTSEKVQNQSKFIEGVGLYWHMVDLLWVILFSLIYLAP